MLSKQAAEDSFLREALEGLDAFPEGDHTGRLERLHQRLAARTRRRIIPLFIQQAAAAVLVIGLLGLGWWLLSDGREGIPTTDSPEEVAIQPAAPVPDASPPLVEHTPSTTRKEIPQPAPPPSRMEETTTPSVSPQPTELAAAEKPAAVLPAETAGAATAEWAEAAPAPEQKKENIAAPKTTDSGIAPPQPARATAIAPSQPASVLSPPAGFRLITGKILDEAGEPLIGATVLLQGTQQGAVTDIDGNYSLQIPEKNTNARVVVAYTGFETRVVEVGDRQKINVQLNTSHAALSEVVVVGGGRKLRKAGSNEASRSFSMELQPQGGWDALERHISQNRRVPVQAMANGVSGQVLVEFSVTTKGKLRDFRVPEPLGSGCDEEAVRLLQTGPKWRNDTGKEQRTSYPVKF